MGNEEPQKISKATTYARRLALLLITGLPALAEDSKPQVNVNTASLEQLAYLPGIGPATADNLLYAREEGVTFTAPSDLEQVSGIGPVTVEKVSPYVCFADCKTTAIGKLGSKEKATTTKYKRPKEDS